MLTHAHGDHPGSLDEVASNAPPAEMLLLVMATIGLTGDDAHHAIRGLRAILHGFTSLESAEGYKMALNAWCRLTWYDGWPSI